MNYIPPTENDILDTDDDEGDENDDGMIAPADNDGMIAPADNDDGDNEERLAGSPTVNFQEDNAIPDIDQDEEDQRILNSIQNADANNRVFDLDELLNHIVSKNLNLRLRRPTSMNGNCLFDSLVDLVEKFEIVNVPRCQNLLRQAICNSMMRHPEFPTWMSLHFKRPVVFQLFLKNMKRSGTYCDNMGLMIAASAHFLGNNFDLNSVLFS